MANFKRVLQSFLQCEESVIKVLEEKEDYGTFKVDDDEYRIYNKETFKNLFSIGLIKTAETALKTEDLSFLFPYIHFEDCPITPRTVKSLMYGTNAYYEFLYFGDTYSIIVS